MRQLSALRNRPARWLSTCRAAGAAALLCAIAASACGPSTTAFVESPLALNEIMPSNQTGPTDEAGDTDDWIEIINMSDQDISLGGYFISDDDDDPRQVLLSDSLVVPADGVIVLWADGEPEQGAAHLPFRLKADGELITLANPDGDLIDRYRWSNAVGDQSFARVPDGDGPWVRCDLPTPEIHNGDACGP